MEREKRMEKWCNYIFILKIKFSKGLKNRIDSVRWTSTQLLLLSMTGSHFDNVFCVSQGKVSHTTCVHIFASTYINIYSPIIDKIHKTRRWYVDIFCVNVFPRFFGGKFNEFVLLSCTFSKDCLVLWETITLSFRASEPFLLLISSG